MDQTILIERMMTGLRAEVERVVYGFDAEQPMEPTETRYREFGKQCGGIAFELLMQTSLSVQEHGYVGPTVPTAEGPARFERYEMRWVQTHLGRFQIRRAYYWNSAASCGVIPLDERWGLDEREPSCSLRTSVAMLSAEVPFARAARLMNQVGLVELPVKRMQESSQAVGHTLKEARDRAVANVPTRAKAPYADIEWVAPAERSGTLYVLMDGGRVQMMTGEWKEPKVATLYWDSDCAEVCKDRTEILKKEYIATLGDADELAAYLWEAAVRWKFFRAARVVVLGDGAPWIWNRTRTLFPDAIQILDRYHVNEKLWHVARLMYGGSGKHKDKRGPVDHEKNMDAEDPKTDAWAHQLMDRLDHDDIDGVLSELNQAVPPSQEARSALEDTAHYIDENRARMLYGTYRNQGLSIGSGPIESAVKNVVNLRMKGCGMRWAKDRAEHMLHLRAAHLSTIGPPNGLLQAA